MSSALFRNIASVMSVSAMAAALNLLGTVLIARWFGTAAYAVYIVNLAIISLWTILLEIVPSSYSVFRVQDDPTLLSSLASLSVVSGLALAVAVVSCGFLIDSPNGFSIWMAAYAALMSIKRYLDILLQSSGRLQELFWMEVVSAANRVVLMGVFILLGMESNNSIWASLALGTFISQGIWLLRNMEELEPFTHVFSFAAWRPLIENRSRYFPYYFGIATKRAKDNLVPLIANVFFISKETAGGFFLAYRGLIFTCGQIRVIEGIINHRKSLEAFDKLSFQKIAGIAIVGQVVCLGVSSVLLLLSGVVELPLITLILLSCIVWANVFSVLMRAGAYSRYQLAGINASMLAYIATAVSLAWGLRSVSVHSDASFAGMLFMADVAALIVMYRFNVGDG